VLPVNDPIKQTVIPIKHVSLSLPLRAMILSLGHPNKIMFVKKAETKRKNIRKTVPIAKFLILSLSGKRA